MINNYDTTINNYYDTTINILYKDEMFSDKSNLSPLIAMHPQFSFVQSFSLISTIDKISDFPLAGSADGAGFVKDGDNYIYVVNNNEHAFPDYWIRSLQNTMSFSSLKTLPLFRS